MTDLELNESGAGLSVDVQGIVVLDPEPGEECGLVVLAPGRGKPTNGADRFSGGGAAPGKAGVAVNLQ